MSRSSNSGQTVNTENAGETHAQEEMIQPSENYDQDGNYNTINNALAAKPEILRSKLPKTKPLLHIKQM